MTLRELQRQAWDVAEEKGQHDNLRDPQTYGYRERALANITTLYAAVTLLTQYIKRNGAMDGTAQRSSDLENLFHVIAQNLQDTAEHIFHDRIDPEKLECLPTHLRLALAHTEVDEADDAARDNGLLGEELADIFIRIGDLAHDRGIDLDAVVTAKMAKNRQRPYAYGTPRERGRA